MRTITKCLLIAFLFMPFLSSLAQQGAGTGALTVGDKAPAISYYKWIKGKKIGAYEPGKVYVVEFTATWCTPCAKMIPQLTSLAKQYAGQVDIVGMFVKELNTQPKNTPDPAYVKRVEQYIEKRKGDIGYSMAVDDPGQTMVTRWLDRAGKQGIPQSFVIDKAGYIAYIGSNPDALAGALKKVTGPGYRLADMVRFAQKVNAVTTYDYEKPLLIDGNGGPEDEFLFRSVLVKAKGDFPSGLPSHVSSYRFAEKGTVYESLQAYQGRFQITNAPVSYLYQLAYMDTLSNFPYLRNTITELWPDTVRYPALRSTYGRFWREPLIEVSDTTLFQKTTYGAVQEFHYSLIMPKEIATAAALQEALRRDLQTYFGFQASVEQRKMPCWVLKRDPASTVVLKAADPSRNFYQEDLGDGRYRLHSNDMLDIISRLIFAFDLKQKPATRTIGPFIDETGFKGRFDFDMTEAEFAAFEQSMEGAKQFLQKLGLTLTKEERYMNVVVIRDPVKRLP